MNRMSTLLSGFVLLLSGLAHQAQATGLPPDQDDLLEDVGQYSPPWFAELQDVELVGDRAYVFGVGGMAIFDISNPTTPLEIGRYIPPGRNSQRFYRGAINGNLACGGGRKHLLTIIDMSTPEAPASLAIHGGSGQSYEGAEMDASYIYACRHSDGFEIVDITNPSQPVTAATIGTLVNSWDVAVDGNIAYVADGLGGLAVIDITDRQAPVHLTSVTTSGAAVDVVTNGAVAVVSAGSAGCDIFDLSNPVLPVRVSTVNTSSLAITTAIAGDILYVADWDDVESFDISDPAVPILIGGEDTPVRAMGLDARADLLVVADWSRVRLYQPGPSTRGDILVPVDGISLGFLEVGATVDTTITLGNTGGAAITVSNVQEFGENYEILTPLPIVIPAGSSADLTIRYSHLSEGYAATFVRIESDDSDEFVITFPISADDNPSFLNLGNAAPDWIKQDTDGVLHALETLTGRVVVMAFFANW